MSYNNHIAENLPGSILLWLLMD